MKILLKLRLVGGDRKIGYNFHGLYSVQRISEKKRRKQEKICIQQLFAHLFRNNRFGFMQMIKLIQMHICLILFQIFGLPACQLAN